MRKLAPRVRKMKWRGNQAHKETTNVRGIEYFELKTAVWLLSIAFEEKKTPTYRALLPDLVEDFAVDQSLLPLVLHLGHLDHIPQQVEREVDGQRGLFAPF